MILDSNLTLDQLVSCDSCYAIFSPDNIFEGAQAEKHICPRCENKQDVKRQDTKRIETQLDKKFKELYENLLIEVTRIIDVREQRFKVLFARMAKGKE